MTVAWISATPSGGDPFWSDVVLLAGNESGTNGTSTFDDASANNHTLTAVGGAVWSNTSPPSGLTTWIHFPGGSDDGVSAADHATLRLGGGDFTIDGYVRLGNTGTRTIISKGDDGSGAREWWIQTVFSEGIKFTASSDGTALDIANGKALSASFSTGVNYHFAVVRSGNTWYAFLDGVQGSTWSSSASIFGGTSTVMLGHFSSLGAAGLIDSLIVARITKAARWTSNFTPPPLPYPTS